MPSGAPCSPDSPYTPLAAPPQPSVIVPLISLNLEYCSAFGSQSSELFFLYSLLGDLTQSHSFKYNLYADYTQNSISRPDLSSELQNIYLSANPSN